MGLGLAFFHSEREQLHRAAARFALLPLSDLVIEAGLLREHANDVANPPLERARSRARIGLIRLEVAMRQRRGES